MTDPLLTIEDATREFRVSPKTIRRRLTSGEIPGAYKRPGSRGPEWVMPRGSLADAGFAPRRLVSPSELPADVEERGSYWERRAIDAEAALQASRNRPASPSRPTPSVSPLAWAFVAASVVIAVLAGLVVAGDGGSEAPEPAAAGAMGAVAALLEAQTERGDTVGLVGERRSDAIPSGRIVAPSPEAGWDAGSGPRFVVATFAQADVPAAAAALRGSAELLLRMPHRRMLVEVFDRGPVGVTTADEVANPSAAADPGVATTLAPSRGTTVPPGETSSRPGTSQPDAATPDPGPASSGGPAAGAAPPPVSPVAPVSDEPGPTADREPAPTALTPGSEVEVSPGESFWSIAERVVSEDLGTDASVDAVTAYWSTLVSANADQLVDPGNPDLLHVGQTLSLPALS